MCERFVEARGSLKSTPNAQPQGFRVKGVNSKGLFQPALSSAFNLPSVLDEFNVLFKACKGLGGVDLIGEGGDVSFEEHLHFGYVPPWHRGDALVPERDRFSLEVKLGGDVLENGNGQEGCTFIDLDKGREPSYFVEGLDTVVSDVLKKPGLYGFVVAGWLLQPGKGANHSMVESVLSSGFPGE